MLMPLSFLIMSSKRWVEVVLAEDVEERTEHRAAPSSGVLGPFLAQALTQ